VECKSPKTKEPIPEAIDQLLRYSQQRGESGEGNKEALDYWQDYQNLLAVNEMAHQHLRDGRLSMKGIPVKLRGIADEFLKSKDITQRVKPISILSPDFEKGVTRRARSKTKAAEVEHAIRHYIDLNITDDPELFASFAEALENILRDFKDNWDKIYEELEKLRQKIKAKEQEHTYGLDRKKQMPTMKGRSNGCGSTGTN